MSHGAIHASAEGAKVERSLSTSFAADEHGGGCGHVVQRGSDFPAPRLSLSRASCATLTTCRSRRADAAHHLQDFRQCHSRAARVCRRQPAHVERSCDSCHYGVRGARSPSWLVGATRVMSVSNILSIVCSLPSSSRSTTSSFPIVCG